MCTKRVVVGCAAPPFYPIMTALASAPPLIVTIFWLMSDGIMYHTVGIKDGTGAELKHTNAQIAVFVYWNDWMSDLSILWRQGVQYSPSVMMTLSTTTMTVTIAIRLRDWKKVCRFGVIPGRLCYLIWGYIGLIKAEKAWVQNAFGSTA